MNKITLSERELKGLLNVTYAVAKEDTRPILQGVCFNKNEVVAIDGYRLAKRTVDKNIDFGNFILKANDVNDIHKRLKLKDDKVNIIIDADAVEFEIERLQEKLSFIPIDGTYVKYESLLNDIYRYKVDLNKEQTKELKEILKSIKGLKTILQLDLSENGLIISNHTKGERVKEIECNVEISRAEEKNFYIGVNKKFFKNALDNYNQCSIYFNARITAIYITDISNELDINKSLDLVLPVRLIKEVDDIA